MSSDFLTKRQAAQRLNASTRMIDRLAEAGKLERIALSSRASRITSASLDAYMSSRPTNQGGGPTPTDFDGFTVSTVGMLGRDAGFLREVLDHLLGQSFPAISVWQSGSDIAVGWPVRCGYGDGPIKLFEQLREDGRQQMAIAARKAAKKPS